MSKGTLPGRSVVFRPARSPGIGKPGLLALGQISSAGSAFKRYPHDPKCEAHRISGMATAAQSRMPIGLSGHEDDGSRRRWGKKTKEQKDNGE